MKETFEEYLEDKDFKHRAKELKKHNERIKGIYKIPCDLLGWVGYITYDNGKYMGIEHNGKIYTPEEIEKL